MSSVIILSGPIGAGKTTVARELIKLLPAPTSYIEGDTFWSYITNPGSRTQRENFQVITRATTAAAIPFAKSGFSVLVDFSIPPQFLATARKILKELPLNYVMLCPPEAICQTRAANRSEGKIEDYSLYKDFYALFATEERFTICNDHEEALVVAARINEELQAGKFRVD